MKNQMMWLYQFGVYSDKKTDQCERNGTGQFKSIWRLQRISRKEILL
jgi:hypothetical protein